MKLYHFTHLRHAYDIIAEGMINRTESNVSHNRANGGPRVVWLLDEPEVTRPHGLVIVDPTTGAVQQVPETEDKTRVRFTVDVQAIRWLDWGPRKGMNPTWLRAIVNAGGGWSAARHWWVSEAAIPDWKWLAVDVLTQGQADPLKGEFPAAWTPLRPPRKMSE